MRKANLTRCAVATYHFGVQEGIVEGGIGVEQLGAQEGAIGHIPEGRHVNGIGFVVRDYKGPYRCHGCNVA